MQAFEEVIEFLASQGTPEAILNFHPSLQAQQRVDELLALAKGGGLSVEQRGELDHYLQLEHIMRLVKARARMRLPKTV